MYDFRDSEIYRIYSKAHGLIQLPPEDILRFEMYRKWLGIKLNNDPNTQVIRYVMNRGPDKTFTVFETIPVMYHPELLMTLDDAVAKHLDLLEFTNNEKCDALVTISLRRLICARASLIFDLFDSVEQIGYSETLNEPSNLPIACARTLYGDFRELVIEVAPKEETDPNLYSADICGNLYSQINATHSGVALF